MKMIGTKFRYSYADHVKYYANLKVGQVVHYHNAFENVFLCWTRRGGFPHPYVRCEVVRDGVENKLKPIALVGDWRPRWERSNYYGKYITNGHLFTPSYTCIYEVNPSLYKHSDPRKLKAIDLSGQDVGIGEGWD